MGTLSTTGYTKATAAEWLADLRADWLSEYGAGTDVSDDSPDGIFLRILSQYLAEQDEGQLAVYQAMSRASAAGSVLDNLAAFLGLSRNAATYSTITSAGVRLTGTPSTVIPALTEFSVSATGAVFRLDADVTIGLGGYGTGTATAKTTGPLAAAISALDTIDTPVSGLTSVTNTVAAALGTNQETDEELRARMDRALSSAGRGTPNALQVRVADLDGVTSCKVIENNTDAAVSGQPPHSFQVVVLGGTAQDIVDEIWASKPTGIPSYGSSSGTATDAAGDNKSVYYTVPSSVRMRILTVLTVDGDFPSDGLAQVKRRILFRLANGLTESEVDDGSVTTGQGVVGEDVLSGLVVRAIYEVPGVVSHTGPFIEDAAPPTATGNFTIGSTEVATFDVADMTVTTT